MEAERVNAEYDRNIIKKRGEDELLELQLMKQKELSNPTKHKLTEQPFIDEIIPDLIAENERLWKDKRFYKPKKNRRKVEEKMTAK